MGAKIVISLSKSPKKNKKSKKLAKNVVRIFFRKFKGGYKIWTAPNPDFRGAKNSKKDPISKKKGHQIFWRKFGSAILKSCPRTPETLATPLAIYHRFY